MPTSNTIQVYENQPIAYKGRYQDARYTEELHDRLLAYNDKHPECPYFELIHYGVKFTSYVGAIQVGNTVIEVLPKVGKTGDAKMWQTVLLDMLRVSLSLKAKQAGTAQLKRRPNSILDLYFQLYLMELEKLQRRGWVKKYRTQEGQVNSLRGSLQFHQQIARNLIHKERFYTRHVTYDTNHMLHRILWEALDIVRRLSNSSIISDQVQRMQLDFPEVGSGKLLPEQLSKVSLNRKTAHYEQALDIAKLLILNFRPDVAGGSHDLLALMFDMNRLWEDYVYQMLRRSLHSEWTIEAQARDLFWERKSIRPDIVLRSHANNQTVVIDTKWKIIDRNHPADDDLKQMFVYNHHWNATLGILLYPWTESQADHTGQYHLPNQNGTHHCQLSFIKVIDEKGLRKDIGEQVRGKLGLIGET